jgi:hypothetical protein
VPFGCNAPMSCSGTSCAPTSTLPPGSTTTGTIAFNECLADNIGAKGDAFEETMTVHFTVTGPTGSPGCSSSAGGPGGKHKHHRHKHHRHKHH